MEFIGIFIVVCIIYYLKKKKDERDSANDFQIKPDSNESNGSYEPNAPNPFVADNSNPFTEDASTPFIAEEVLETENEIEAINSTNPFIDDSSDGYYEEEAEPFSDGYVFPSCPVTDKTFTKSSQRAVKRFSFNNSEFNAITYVLRDNLLGDRKLLLFQKISNENGQKKVSLVDYGFYWLKILNEYIETLQIPSYDLQSYDNIKEMPSVPDEQLEDLYEIEKDVKSIYDDVQQIPLTFGDGTEKVFWKFGDVSFGNNEYHFLMSQINPDDTIVFRVTSNGEGYSYDEVTNPSTLDMILKAFHKKYDK